MQIYKNISLINYNTFRVDVTADNLVLIEQDSDLNTIVKDDHLSKQKKFFLGAGSNLLITNPISGLTIKNIQDQIRIIEDTADYVIIETDSGLQWHSFLEYCIENGYYGLENLALIPGLLGAAPVQNIGAYGVEQNQFFHSLLCVDINSGKNYELFNKDCKFDYRYSIFKQENYRNCFITKVRYRLSKHFNPNLSYKELKNYFGEKKDFTAQDIFQYVVEIRQNKLPDHNEYPNAGSFFKNPVVTFQKLKELLEIDPSIVYFPAENNLYKVSAANLIEKTGLKGFKINNVGISTKHSLIIVNFGNSSGKEIYEFSNFIILKVFDKFLIELEPEVIIL